MNAFPVSVACYTLIFRCLLPVFLYHSRSLFRLSIKCFYSQFTGSKVLLNLSSISPLDSRPLVLRCIRDALVCLFMSFLASFSFLSSQAFAAIFLSSSRGFPFSFLPSLSSSVFFSSLLPSCRAHNCITERLFSQLTLFSFGICSVTLLTFPVWIRTHTLTPEQNCIICSYPQQNGTKRTT